MDQKIGLHFGTTYDGKGTRNLKNGIDSAHSAVTRLKDSIKNMGSSIGSSLKTVGSNLMNIKAGFDMLIGVAKKVGEVIKNAFDMSRLENNFKFLIGSTDEARRHMEMLYELGRTPPFSTKEFASASKTMMLLTNNVLGGKDSLVMLGDAADAVGVPIETMAETVGYFYEMLRDGQPISRAAKQLVRMGAITPAVADKMKTMQEEGSSLSDIWRTLTTELNKFQGAMDNTARSTGGKIAKLEGVFDEFKAKLGVSFAEGFEKEMDKVGNSLDKLADNKSWVKLANMAGQFLGKLADVGGKFGDMVASIGTDVLGKAGVKPTPGLMDKVNKADAKDKALEPKKDPQRELNKAEWAKMSDALHKDLDKLISLNYRFSDEENERLREIEAAIFEGMQTGDKPDRMKEIISSYVKPMVDQWSDIKKTAEKLSVDQDKIAENNRKAVEEETKAQEEAAKKASKGVYNQEMQRREDLKNTMLTQIRNRLEKIHEQQKKQKFYIDNSNGGHDGNNGFGEGNRPVDENGRFLRPEHQQEANRQADRGERNLDSQRMGENRQAALRQQYDDLKKQIDKNVGGVEGLSDRDRQRYNQLKGFFDPEEDKLNKAADQIKKSDLTELGTKLDDIKTALENSLKIN